MVPSKNHQFRIKHLIIKNGLRTINIGKSFLRHILKSLHGYAKDMKSQGQSKDKTISITNRSTSILYKGD